MDIQTEPLYGQRGIWSVKAWNGTLTGLATVPPGSLRPHIDISKSEGQKCISDVFSVLDIERPVLSTSELAA